MEDLCITAKQSKAKQSKAKQSKARLFIMALIFQITTSAGLIAQLPDCQTPNLWGNNYTLIEHLEVQSKFIDLDSDSYKVDYNVAKLQHDSDQTFVYQLDVLSISASIFGTEILFDENKLMNVTKGIISDANSNFIRYLSPEMKFLIKMKFPNCFPSFLHYTLDEDCTMGYCTVFDFEMTFKSEDTLEVSKKMVYSLGLVCYEPCSITVDEMFDDDFIVFLGPEYPPCNPSCYWTLQGNSNVSNHVNFIGPTNGADFIIKTGDEQLGLLKEKMRITSSGEVSIGLINPVGKFSVRTGEGYGNKISFAEENFNPSIRLTRRTGSACSPTTTESELAYPWWIEANDDWEETGVYGGLFFKTGPAQCSDGNETVSTKVTFTREGRVGIGVVKPEYVLDLKIDEDDSEAGLFSAKNSTSQDVFRITREGSTNIRLLGENRAFYIQDQNDKTIFTVRDDGNVGIGVAGPSVKLAVDGTICAKEVLVKLELCEWPDYVFSDNYKLAGLGEIERFIKANKHLPDMPSSADVQANGVELGTMQALLLKKIEELTLHLIELKKENEEIKKILKGM